MDFCVILVTYNRVDCLKKTLQMYSEQIKKPKYIIVVNNASTDDTGVFLSEWLTYSNDVTKHIVINCNENLGGSGGFDIGIKKALKYDSDFLFLSDDDAFPEDDMLLNLEVGYNEFGDSDVVALCTSVFNYNERELSHRCVIHKGIVNLKFEWISEKEYENKTFEVDILTFVGAAIKTDIARKVGSVKKEYFIYFDDSDYSIRLRKFGKILCVPNSIMHHNVGHDRRSSWKDYYDTRNWIDLVHNNFSYRYYVTNVIKMYVKRCSILAWIMRKRDIKHRWMCLKAIRDGISGNLGKNV